MSNDDHHHQFSPPNSPPFDSSRPLPRRPSSSLSQEETNDNHIDCPSPETMNLHSIVAEHTSSTTPPHLLTNAQAHEAVVNILHDTFTSLRTVLLVVATGQFSAPEAFDDAYRSIAHIVDNLRGNWFAGESLLDKFAAQLQGMADVNTALFVRLDFVIMGFILLVDDVVRVWERYLEIRARELKKQKKKQRSEESSALELLAVEQYEAVIWEELKPVTSVVKARWNALVETYDLAIIHRRMDEVGEAAPVPFITVWRERTAARTEASTTATTTETTTPTARESQASRESFTANRAGGGFYALDPHVGIEARVPMLMNKLRQVMDTAVRFAGQRRDGEDWNFL